MLFRSEIGGEGVDEFKVSGIEMIGYWGVIAQVISEFNPAELEAETCPYADDGECDEPFLCAEGTDGNDCGSSSGSSLPAEAEDRKSTRLNSSHKPISYAVFCLKKKKKH